MGSHPPKTLLYRPGSAAWWKTWDNEIMGLFDLGDYFGRKKRADESATPPRAFPETFADTRFDGKMQTLRFRPTLYDGGHVFIAFAPKDALPEHELVVGNDHDSALTLATDNAFDANKWQALAVRNVGDGHFGRLRVEEENGYFQFHFFSANGRISTENYMVICDGSWGRFAAQARADFDPNLDFQVWSEPAKASEILARLNEPEFFRFLEEQRSNSGTFYGLSLRWPNMDERDRREFLPPLELEVERELVPLMRAVVWSDPVFQGGALLGSGFDSVVAGGRNSERPFWRRPRFSVQNDRKVGEVLHLENRFERRIEAIWPHLAAYFAPILAGQSAPLHPSVAFWMHYRGAYLVEFDAPNAHEHLEARLQLRDWLRLRGVELDVLERKLR